MSTTPKTPSPAAVNGAQDGTRAALLANPSHNHLNVPGQSPYASNTASRTSSDASIHVVKNQPGYTTPVFKDKAIQKASVEKTVQAKVRSSSASSSSLPLRVLTNYSTGLHTQQSRRQRGRVVLQLPPHRRHLLQERDRRCHFRPHHRPLRRKGPCLYQARPHQALHRAREDQCRRLGRHVHPQQPARRQRYRWARLNL